MRKVRTAGVLALLLSISSLSAGSFYGGVRAGVDFEDEQPKSFETWQAGTVQVKRRPGPMLAVAFGYEFSPGWRTEVEVFGSRNVYEFSYYWRRPVYARSQSLGLMCNGGARLPSVWRLQPFTMVGVGAVYINERIGILDTIKPVDHHHVVGATQVIAGVEYPLTAYTLAGVQYRVVGTWKGARDHSAELSIRQRF